MKRGFSPLMLSGVVVLFSLSAAKAATDTWVGSPTLNWSSTANWFSGLLPLSGDSLVFGPTSYGTTLTDNLMTPGTFNLGGITFNSGAPAYTINPGILGTNGFTLTGGIVNNSVSTQTINDAISLSGTQTFTTSAGGGNLTLGGFVSGTGSVTVAGGGLLTLASSLGNSFSGPTIVSGGTLRAISSNSNTLNAALDLNFGNGVVLNSGTMAVAITVGETAGNVAPLYSATGGPNGMGMMYLNGANYLDIQPKSGNLTNLSSSASYTIGMWIETSTPGASLLYKGVIGNWGTNDQIFYLGAAASGATTLVGPDGAGGHVAGVQYAGGWVGSNTNVNTGRWEYVTYVRSGGTTTTYVNGVATGTSTGMSGPEQGTQDIRIGYNDTDTGDGAQMFLGSVSDIQVYGIALTSTQVKSLYNGGALGSLSGSSQVQLPNSGAGLDVNGTIESIPALSGVGGSLVFLGGGALAVGADNSSQTFSGVISDTGGASSAVGGSLTKVGIGTLTLNASAVNTYSGPTNVNGGTLLLDFTNLATPVNLISGSSALGLGGGTLAIKGQPSVTSSQAFAGTAVTGPSALNFNSNGGTLNVALGAVTRTYPGTADVHAAKLRLG